jgi:HEPN domain-containing protein
MDINGQIAYWRNSSSEDWQVALELIENGHVRHGLFFVHLAMEKILKAHVTRKMQDIPSTTHPQLAAAM